MPAFWLIVYKSSSNQVPMMYLSQDSTPMPISVTELGCCAKLPRRF